MISRSFLLAAAIAILQASVAAEDGKSPNPQEPEVVMPVMKVPATRLKRFGIMNQRGPSGDRLLICHVPMRSDMFKMLVGGAQVGDEIVSIDGQDVATIPTNKRVGMLSGYFKLVVKRPVGRRSFQLLELDGRHD
ncbi:MAG: hypothetical protein Q7S40_04645 [Opitutaceae bacterium]|nr:hypothetical protein [Opitutaceae bacterium]